ncbi:MAG TPA: NUDIX domain-containing protein [Jatrophihabitans sp.]|nr:NUDIX domain-containing protein [Jatrophihabitans sp.]
MTSGDGWVHCAAGHRHWGRFGAAGLLLHRPGDDQVILQHRAAWTHEGDRWGIPGGARHSDEDAVEAALREAAEEAGLQPADVEPVGLYIDDHGGWSYSTVVARATRAVQPTVTDAESVTVRWQPAAGVAGLPLHSGFAAAWQSLRVLPPLLNLVAAAPLAGDPRLARLAREGIATPRLPTGVRAGGLHRLYPHPLAEGSPAVTGNQVITVRTTDDLAALAGPEPG